MSDSSFRETMSSKERTIAALTGKPGTGIHHVHAVLSPGSDLAAGHELGRIVVLPHRDADDPGRMVADEEIDRYPVIGPARKGRDGPFL